MNKTINIVPQISDEIRSYTDVLIKNAIKPKMVILFGSFAKEEYSDYSDIDLAIISDQFGKDEIEEMMRLKKLAIRVSDRIDPIPLNSKLLNNKYHPLIGEIKKYGKVVYKE